MLIEDANALNFVFTQIVGVIRRPKRNRKGHDYILLLQGGHAILIKEELADYVYDLIELRNSAFTDMADELADLTDILKKPEGEPEH